MYFTTKELVRLQRQILRSRKWKRFTAHFPPGVDRPKRIGARPVRFIAFLPETREGTLPIMEAHDDEIIVSELVFNAVGSKALAKVILTHELVHIYLGANQPDSQDSSVQFRKALQFLGIDYQMQFAVLYRKRGSKGAWKT